MMRGRVLALAAMRGWFSGLRERLQFVLPGRSCWPIGWLCVLSWAWDEWLPGIDRPELSTRDSEITEVYIYGFILIYAITLRGRIRRVLAPARLPQGAAGANRDSRDPDRV